MGAHTVGAEMGISEYIPEIFRKNIICCPTIPGYENQGKRMGDLKGVTKVLRSCITD